MLVRSADCSCDWLARYAQRRQTEIKNELSAIRGAAKKPQIAAKYGVDVKDAQVLQNLIKQMTAEQKRWANFGIHPDLVKEANNAVMLAMGLKSQEQVELENREARVAAGTDNLLGFGMDQDGNAVMDGEDGMRSDGATGVLFGDEVGIQDGLWANTNVLGQEDAQSKSNVSASLAEGTNFSLAEAKERGLFQDGVMVAGNGVVTEPGVSFSTINDLLHASGARFNEFDLSKIGSGTGIQIYGFGVYLAQAHDLKHNRRYWEKAKEKYGQAFNYRVSFNADESELVVWDRRTPEALLDAAVSEFGVERDAVGFVDDFYFDLARRFGGKVEGARMASEWLYGHGVKGVKTGLEEDAFIVAFNERDVRITAVNELDYWSEKEGWRNVAPAFDAVARDVDLAVSHSLAEGVRAEMESIKEQAVVNGTFMRAPNGAETKLTEGQWLSVRTGAFKDWFGDWENDAANASKVVDENGEPMVVYHGTWRSGFTVFGKGEKRFAGSPDGAYFFSPNKNVALAYSGFEGREVDLGGGIQEKESRAIYSSFLNMRNPKVVDFGGSSYMHEVYGVKGVDGNEYWKDDEGHVFYTDDDARAYAEEHGLEIEDGKVQGKIRTTDDEAQRAKAEGYDGIIIRNVRDATDWWGKEDITDDDYVAFEPNQIKSATQNRGTFDSSNPDITFSVTDAKEQGLFRDGVMVTDNAIIIEPGVSFSTIDNLYHASPADFRKFDLSKMGSGLGVQAYGYGIYLADNEDVNNYYWHQFAARQQAANSPIIARRGAKIAAMGPVLIEDAKDFFAKAFNVDKDILTDVQVLSNLRNCFDKDLNTSIQKIEAYQKHIEEERNKFKKYFEELQDVIKKNGDVKVEAVLNQDGSRGIRIIPNDSNEAPFRLNASVEAQIEQKRIQKLEEQSRLTGEIVRQIKKDAETNKSWDIELDKLQYPTNYRASFNAEEEELLLWNEADPKIAELKAAFEKEEGMKLETLLLQPDEVVDLLIGPQSTNHGYTGENFYNDLVEHFYSQVSSKDYIQSRREAQKKASEWLYAHGIKGNKHLDETRQSEGAYNYVVFNDKDIKITAYSNADHWTMDKNAWTPYHDNTVSWSLTSHNPLEQTPYNTYNERRKGNADGRQESAAGSTAQSIASRSDGEDQQLSGTAGVSQADGSGRGRRAGRNVGSNTGLSSQVGRGDNRATQSLALTEEGVQPGTLEQAKAILQNVRAANKNGACVDLPSAIKGAIRFVISDGHGGATVTVKADGDICALGKEPSCQIKGVAHKLLITAIRHGGIKMDCYGINLVNIYAKYGFKPVARVAYNAEYADEDMKAYVRDVRNGVAPDVYVLMHDGSTLREAKARGARLFEQAYRRHTKIPTSKGGDAVRERSEWRDFVWSTAC